MFENVTPPEDIFEDVDSTAPPTIPSSAPASLPPSSEATVPVAPNGGFPWKPILIGVAALFIVAAAGTLAFFLIASREPVVPEAPDEVSRENEPLESASSTDEPAADEPEAVIPPLKTENESDRDRDGLTDDEEARYQTSPTASDTDADGLFDKEEVQTYDTDPTNPDTDGDGYQDGSEVEKGYSPTGPGKLFEIPE